MRNRDHRATNRRLARPGLIACALTWALSLAIWPAAPLRAAEISDPDTSAVDLAATAIERQLEEMGVRQGAYAVISGNQQQVSGFGAASGDTPFVIGSVSKSFTALAIVQLVERGLIALDSPVTDYASFTTTDSTSPIRVRHLLNQTSGALRARRQPRCLHA